MSKKSYRPNIYKVEPESEPKEEIIAIEEPEVVEVQQILEEFLPQKLYTVQVTHPSLRRRNGPSLDHEVLGLIEDKGLYDIYEEKKGWGRLKDNSWIMLDYTLKVKHE